MNCRGFLSKIFYIQCCIFRAMKQRIKNKLQDPKKEATKAESYKVNDDEDDTKEDEYYLGKDRDDERKRKAYVFLFEYYLQRYIKHP